MVCVCVCMRARTCVYTRACVSVYVLGVFAIYDNHISPMLIMIIIKIINLYFIQIGHTDDFPSTGTQVVLIKL